MSTRSVPLALLSGILLLVWQPDARGIINGTATEPDDFPWIAALVKKGSFASAAVIGGGTLVGDQWVVTAAHSLIGESPGSIEIWLQTPDLNDPSLRIRRSVLAIYRHPDFLTENGTSRNDVAMLLLDQPVSTIPPVPVETTEDDLFEGDTVKTAGWGITTPDLPLPSTTLQQTTLALMTRGDANLFYGGILDVAHIPARDPLIASMPCFGDSGGPLLKNVDGVDTLIGLVSFGPDTCGNASIPSIYTNLTYYGEWIRGFLDRTGMPPEIILSGKGREIRNGDRSARLTDNTDFGRLREQVRQRSRSFRVGNTGDGLLTIRASRTSGKRFTIRKAPRTILEPDQQSAFRIQFRSPRRKGRYRSVVRLFTNDPGMPVLSFGVRARIR